MNYSNNPAYYTYDCNTDTYICPSTGIRIVREQYLALVSQNQFNSSYNNALAMLAHHHAVKNSTPANKNKKKLLLTRRK